MGEGSERLPRVVEVTHEKFHLHGDPDFLVQNLDEMYTFDFVREDRRRLVGAPTANREEFVQQLRGWHGISHGPPQFSVEEILAVRGERCILIRARVLYADTWSEFLSVGRIDDEDRTDRSVLFDPDDTESAIADPFAGEADLVGALSCRMFPPRRPRRFTDDRAAARRPERVLEAF